jgi:sec-independent protein translocase protein TatC
MALVRFPGTSPAASPDQDPDDNLDIELTDADDELDAGGKMSFLEHLDELRKRLIACVVATVVGCAVSFIFIGRIFEFIIGPLKAMLSEGGTFIATEPAEIFMLYLKVGALCGLIVAMPFILWQLWLFVAPGLYAREKRFAIPFVLFSSIFFFAGALFSHYVAFPYTWAFFLGFESNLVKFMPKLGPTFALYVKMLLAFGAIFQMPVLVLALARMGVITAGFLVKHTKYAVLIIFILGAVLSPGGDIPSQVMMAGPMLVLYGVSIVIAWVFGKRKKPDLD